MTTITQDNVMVNSIVSVTKITAVNTVMMAGKQGGGMLRLNEAQYAEVVKALEPTAFYVTRNSFYEYMATCRPVRFEWEDAFAEDRVP
jgi:hypothetical protein